MVATISTPFLTNFVYRNIEKIVAQAQKHSFDLFVLIRDGSGVVAFVWYGSHEMVRSSFLNLLEKIIKASIKVELFGWVS